jgi:putative oxidoreductase
MPGHLILFPIPQKDRMKSLNSLRPIALLVFRAALGVIFFSHGYPKIARGGAGMQAVFLQHGLPGYFAYVTGVLELFGGGLLLLGLFTRGAAFILALEIVFLMWKIYPPHSYLLVSEYEFPLTLATGCFVLATVGAGSISLDRPLFENGARKSSDS